MCVYYLHWLNILLDIMNMYPTLPLPPLVLMICYFFTSGHKNHNYNRGLKTGVSVWKWSPYSPNCWMARSALQGNSRVMWTRLRWFLTRLSACKEIPELAASEIIATSWKERERERQWETEKERQTKRREKGRKRESESKRKRHTWNLIHPTQVFRDIVR